MEQLSWSLEDQKRIAEAVSNWERTGSAAKAAVVMDAVVIARDNAARVITEAEQRKLIGVIEARADVEPGSLRRVAVSGEDAVRFAAFWENGRDEYEPVDGSLDDGPATRIDVHTWRPAANVFLIDRADFRVWCHSGDEWEPIP